MSLRVDFLAYTYPTYIPVCRCAFPLMEAVIHWARQVSTHTHTLMHASRSWYQQTTSVSKDRLNVLTFKATATSRLVRADLQNGWLCKRNSHTKVGLSMFHVKELLEGAAPGTN